MSLVYLLTVPLPPNAANSRRHWRVAQRDKKAYWETLNVLYAAKHFDVPNRPLDPALIAVELYLWNHMDHDNAMARLKPLLDWLKGVWIADDGPKRLLWKGIPEQAIDRENPRAVVSLRAL